MAAPLLFDSGLGETLGSELATSKPLHSTGDAWYVHSGTGSDAASPRGKERIRPLATIAQAVTNAAAGDWIILLDGHAQTIGSSQAINKARLKIIGAGSGDTRPRFTRNFNGVMWDITADDVYIYGVYFVASTLTSTAARIRTANARTEIDACYFEHGTLDTGTGVQFVTGWSAGRIANTTFKSTSTSTSSQPESAITVTNAGTRLDLYKNTFDGGSSGWSNPYAFSTAAAITELRAVLNDQLGDSDGIITTGSTGFRIPRNTSGSARFVWPA